MLMMPISHRKWARRIPSLLSLVAKRPPLPTMQAKCDIWFSIRRSPSPATQPGEVVTVAKRGAAQSSLHPDIEALQLIQKARHAMTMHLKIRLFSSSLC